MHNDSIETLLLRHYGNTASTPSGLEQQLIASVHHNAATIQRQERTASRMRTQPISRRHAVRLVAIGSASLSLLSMGLESLQTLETALVNQETIQQVQSVFP